MDGTSLNTLNNWNTDEAVLPWFGGSWFTTTNTRCVQTHNGVLNFSKSQSLSTDSKLDPRAG